MSAAPLPVWRPTLLSRMWLLSALALVMLPHALHQPLWITGIVIASGALYAWRTQAGRPLPGRALRVLLALGGAAGVLLSYGTVLGRDAGVALLVVMLALKLLELNSLRDAMVAAFLAYFLIVTQFLYEQNIPMAGYLFLAALWVTAALIALNRDGRMASPWEPLGLSGRLLLQSIPLMLVLFILFPRLPGPLWTLPRDAHSGMTGLSDRMEPGSISQLSQSDAVAFRVEFDGTPPPANARYWRGPVLWRFDGRTWTPGWMGVRAADDGVRNATDPVRYTVTLEPNNQRWLFALDMPISAPQGAWLTADFRLVSRKPVIDRRRYTAESALQYTADPDLSSVTRRQALQLPADGDPRARTLATTLRAAARDDSDYVRQILARFRNEPYVYTLSPPLLGQDPVDEFLFETRRGFCEHYAGAFVFLMRAAGVPSRVVTGYQGGEDNPMAGYTIVRQSDAHAWAEVWLKGQGWVRVDPTAAVSPLRIELGLGSAVDLGDPLPFLRRTDLGWVEALRQLRFAWDTLDNYWNQWVLGYGPELQREFLGRLGLRGLTWLGLGLAAVGGAALFTVIIGLVLTRRPRASADPVVRAYLRLCARLSRVGLEREPHETPESFADRVARARPDLADAVRELSELYVRLRYAAVSRDETAVRRLSAGVRALAVRARPRGVV